MRKPNADLGAAIEFVIERVAEEAIRSGAPLAEDERDFLRHLPRHPTNPTVSASWPTREYWFTPHLRDFSFERLCKLAKDARHHDVEARPAAADEWRFAGAILQFNQHPMAWLLNWAGMNTRTGGSSLVTVLAATLMVTLCAVGALITPLLLRGEQGLSFVTICIVCGVAIAAALVFSYIAMQRIDRWLGRRAVERYRCALPVGTSTVNS